MDSNTNKEAQKRSSHFCLWSQLNLNLIGQKHRSYKKKRKKKGFTNSKQRPPSYGANNRRALDYHYESSSQKEQRTKEKELHLRCKL